ncbi:uncharacterized protein LOC131951257 [Physella acuta]|uniref:uncharacterized protein LOC131951257 n=1 Tax=Physella acuta TaxID=109671 RepID=UPI0027DE824F|nr:uncharacterized protein LOC131951257 [Physella acuta]
MNEIIIKPVKHPPVIKQNSFLSAEAQTTLELLEKKYSFLINEQKKLKMDPSHYYKSIYAATFKKRDSNPVSLQANTRHSTSHTVTPDASQLTETITKSHKTIDTNFTKSAFTTSNVPCSGKSKVRNHINVPVLLTEVLSDIRPTDEEIAQDIFKLTQNTRVNSPSMDTEIFLHNSVETDYNPKRHDFNSLDSLVNGNNSFEVTFMQQLNENLKRNFNSKNKENESNIARCFVPEESNECHSTPNQDMFNSVKKRGHDLAVFNNESPLLFSSSNQESEHIQITNEGKVNCKKQVFLINASKDNDMAVSSPEKANFDLQLSDIEFSQNSCHTLEMDDKSFGDNKVNTPESINHTSKLNIQEPIFQDNKVNTPGSIFLTSKLNIQEPIFQDNKINTGESTFPTSKVNLPEKSTPSIKANNLESPISSCNSENKIFFNNMDESESPFIEDPKDVPNVFTCKRKRKTLQKAKQEEQHCDGSSKEVSRLDLKQSSASTLKKIKSGFKPPIKVKTVEGPKTNEKSTLEVLNFSSWSIQQQEEFLESLLSSQCLTLTMLFSNGQALVNTFYSAADHSKPHLKSIVIMTEVSQLQCVAIPMNVNLDENIKNILLQVMASEKICKTICNFKEFIVELNSLFSLDAYDCANVEDPVIASWVVHSENQPLSFSQICRTSNFEFVYNEREWLPCFQFTPNLMKALRVKLKKDNLWTLFKSIEMKLVPILSCMELNSIKVDTEKLVGFSEILKCKLNRLEEAIYTEAGHRFCLNSHVQLRQVLFEELQLDKKLPTDKKIIKTSSFQLKSTCESSLTVLANYHHLPSLVLEYRQLQKLKSTYVDGIIACAVNGLVKTHWDQTAAATGRLTSSQPNFQAIPKNVISISDYKPNYIIGLKSSQNAVIYAREPFISKPEHSFLAADFQQIELRILSHLSQDPILLNIFSQQKTTDIFISLTSQWHNKPPESVTSQERESTKRIVYSIVYGAGKEKLSDYLKVKPQVAKDIMNSFLLQFPSIDIFIKKCWSYAQDHGYTETVCGRRRYFPHINHPSPVLRAQAQRQAVNFCVQGSAADICKLAMIAVENKLQAKEHLNTRLLLQIHDELVWEVPDEHITEAKEVIQQTMEDTQSLCAQYCNLQVPLSVTITRGKSWAHLEPFE